MKRRAIIKQKSTRFITYFYFFLLVYTLAALIWWGISLFHQSEIITESQQRYLRLTVDSLQHPVLFQQEMARIAHEERMREFKYWGEGITFLLVILIGAAYVYRATRRQILLSRQQNNFMMAVTHELKSPIAALQLNLETLLKRKLDPEKQQKLLESMIAETTRLNHLCNNMLLASQFESRQYQMVKEQLNLSELVEQCVLQQQRRVHTHTLVSHIDKDVWIKGDMLTLSLAINNLIENAVKYSPKGSTVEISLHKDQAMAVISVADEGSGIPDAEKTKIFNRFYRIGNENTRKTKGTGLGLYLTQKIVQEHRGIIRVLDRKPQGSIFEIAFPLTRDIIS
ncbi:phospho-acceptor domain-containing protein [Thermoflavifilum aggregans]|uniref:histidine kinase n=1 Tax=Thermoflavifilum aggregans TaxID=454188 RepID=A0A2M9CXS6_9BACT|nr:ATP-binding protein [Thermoflavifilum aggregans]MBX6379127.1 two-component sensor histidine kinase [Thermoflavifilum aggregans]PJJ76724.1 phospho-acceptor domain-containing protein [Thermoflavifilum aggregans]